MHHVIPGAPGSLKIAKAQAKRLRATLNASTLLRTELVHGQALELVAKAHGFESWGHLVAATPADTPEEARRDPVPDLPSRGGFEEGEIGPDPDMVFPADVIFSVGYLLRLVVSASGLDHTSMPIGHLARSMEEVAATPTFFDSPENRTVRRVLGRHLPGPATLVRGDQIPDLLRLVGQAVPDLKDPSGVMRGLLMEGLNALRISLEPRRETDPALFPISVPMRAGPVLSASKPEMRSELRDRRHTLIAAPSLARAREMSRLIDPELCDLTGVGPDTGRLFEVFGLDGVRITHPVDALLWVSGVVSGAALNDGSPAASAPPLTVLLRGSELGGSGPVLLAQARSLKVHVCVWADRETDEGHLTTGLIPNLYRGLLDLGDGNVRLMGPERA